MRGTWFLSFKFRGALAAEADVGSAAGGPDLADRGSAAGAWLAFAQVDLELVLERALGSACVAVVVDRRPLGVDARVQNVDDRLVQALDLGGLQRSDGSQRVDLRAPERL